MKLIFESYAAGETIPVADFVRNRKLVKYFNRETAAAVVAARRLLDGESETPGMPFFYENGIMEFESLGLEAIAAGSLDGSKHFDQKRFVELGTKAVPPLTQFKALYNMPLSFVAIENALNGDNAVVYASARGLLDHAQMAPGKGVVLLGCGKVYADGRVEASFALLGREEIARQSLRQWEGEAITMFRQWHEERAHP